MKILRLLVSLAGVLTVTSLTGCGTAHLWGAKNSGNPASVGADLSFPLGKK